jgi:SnoaL-like domain
MLLLSTFARRYATTSSGEPMNPIAIARWHDVVRARDVAGLESLLADDCVFESPVVHTPQLGKAITTMYLHGALQVLNNESFHYLNEWVGETSAVLEFSAVVDGITINGVDIITWNESDQITHFKVMVRPLKAVNTLHAMMGALLKG